MSRYKTQVVSPAALAIDTGFLWLMGAAGEGFMFQTSPPTDFRSPYGSYW